MTRPLSVHPRSVAFRYRRGVCNWVADEEREKTHGNDRRDKTYHHLYEAGHPRYTPSHVLAKAWRVCASPRLVRKNQHSFENSLDQRSSLQHSSRDGIQRTWQRTGKFRCNTLSTSGRSCRLSASSCEDQDASVAAWTKSFVAGRLNSRW